jgi:putative membrane protein
MIQYNPKDWFTFIFRAHRGDTIRTLLPLIVTIAIYAATIVFLEKDYFHLNDKSFLKNISILHTLLGGVISLLLVFRTNSAYDRWWEGRKLWGELTNNSRNLSIKLASILDEKEVKDREFFKKIIPAFAYALKNHLLSGKAEWELFDEVLNEAQNKRIDREKHIPIQVSQLMYEHLFDLQKQGKITEIQLLFLNDEIKSFMNICGACERIKNTPIPFSYSVFLKKFIFGFVMTLPFSMMFTLGYLSVPIICFIFYVLASLELIAEEIEDPFGGDANDLPMKSMAKNIHKQVSEIFTADSQK